METFLVFNRIKIEDGGGVRLPPPPIVLFAKTRKEFSGKLSLFYLHQIYFQFLDLSSKHL